MSYKNHTLFLEFQIHRHHEQRIKVRSESIHVWRTVCDDSKYEMSLKTVSMSIVWRKTEICLIDIYAAILAHREHMERYLQTLTPQRYLTGSNSRGLMNFNTSMVSQEVPQKHNGKTFP